MRGYRLMAIVNQIAQMRVLGRLLRLLAVALAFCTLPALAADPDKLAASLARQAVQADDGGDPARAAQLYLEAFRTDPTQPNYLYAAARAELSAGQKTQAEEHFEQFLTLADSGTDRADKARAYLADLRGSRAEGDEAAAERAVATSNWAEASKRYEALWVQAPTRWSALFKAGQAAQQAGDKERAGDLLRQYLRDAPKSAADRPEAEDCLHRLGDQPKRAQAPVAVQSDGEAATGGHAVAWTVLGTGLALAVGGAGLLLFGVTEAHALNQDLKLADGYVTADISHAQAQARADAIGMHQTLGAGLAVAGVAAAGVGTWLLLREPDAPAKARLSLAPGPAWTGLALVGRF